MSVGGLSASQKSRDFSFMIARGDVSMQVRCNLAQEAAAVGLTFATERGDQIITGHRCHGPLLALGGEPALEKTGAVGGHPYGLVAYAWHDLTRLVTGADAPGALPPIG